MAKDIDGNFFGNESFELIIGELWDQYYHSPDQSEKLRADKLSPKNSISHIMLEAVRAEDHDKMRFIARAVVRYSNPKGEMNYEGAIAALQEIRAYESP